MSELISSEPSSKTVLAVTRNNPSPFVDFSLRYRWRICNILRDFVCQNFLRRGVGDRCPLNVTAISVHCCREQPASHGWLNCMAEYHFVSTHPVGGLDLRWRYVKVCNGEWPEMESNRRVVPFLEGSLAKDLKSAGVSTRVSVLSHSAVLLKVPLDPKIREKRVNQPEQAKCENSLSPLYSSNVASNGAIRAKL